MATPRSLGSGVSRRFFGMDAAGRAFSNVHRSEVLANPTEPLQWLSRLIASRTWVALLTRPVRELRPTSHPQRRLSTLEIDQLVREYRGGSGSIYLLAKRYGVHRQTISKILKERGLTLGRTSLSDEESGNVVELFDSGLSPNHIAKQLFRDPKTVRALLRSQGLLPDVRR